MVIQILLIGSDLKKDKGRRMENQIDKRRMKIKMPALELHLRTHSDLLNSKEARSVKTLIKFRINVILLQ